MSSSDDTNEEQTTGEIERLPRRLNRRDVLTARRQSILQQKSTDTLPRLPDDPPSGKIALRQVVQLREENKRLRCDLEEQRSEMERLITEYNAAQAEFEKEIEAIHSGQLQEIEHYQNHLRDMMEERDQVRETHLELEQRYQTLYHSFQEVVEEEARKMVAETARTLKLSPEERPAGLQDVAKTLELQVRQLEDQHTAEALYLMREAQRKAAQMEQELDREREQMATERQSLRNMQESMREQARLRHRQLDTHLRARWTVALTAMTTIMLLVLPLLQLVFLSLFHIPFTFHILISLLAPILICLVLAAIFARLRANVGHFYASAPRTKKATKT